MRTYKTWTTTEHQLVLDHYEAKGPDALSKQLGRTPGAVKAYADRYGLKHQSPTKDGRKHPVPFSPEEIKFLKFHYADKGPQFCADHWQRPIQSVKRKANVLGLFYHLKRGKGVKAGKINKQLMHGRKQKFIKLRPDHPLYGYRMAWCPLHHYNWYEANGPIPDGHRLVFRDGDYNNCRADNLELLTLSEFNARQIAAIPEEVLSDAGRKGWKTRERNMRIRLGLPVKQIA